MTKISKLSSTLPQLQESTMDKLNGNKMDGFWLQNISFFNSKIMCIIPSKRKHT
jgi:hypothetical protein